MPNTNENRGPAWWNNYSAPGGANAPPNRNENRGPAWWDNYFDKGWHQGQAGLPPTDPRSPSFVPTPDRPVPPVGGPVYATYGGAGGPVVSGSYIGGGLANVPAGGGPAMGGGPALPPGGGGASPMPGGIPPSMIPGIDGRLPNGQWPPTPGPGGQWPPGMPNVASRFTPAQQMQLERAMGAQGISPWVQGLLGQFGGIPTPVPRPAVPRPPVKR